MTNKYENTFAFGQNTLIFLYKNSYKYVNNFILCLRKHKERRLQ